MTKTAKARSEEKQIATSFQLFLKCEELQELQTKAYWAGRTAPAAYNKHAMDTLDLLALLTNAVKANLAAMEGETINWAHVGDMAAVAGRLQEIGESMSGAGEYAN